MHSRVLFSAFVAAAFATTALGVPTSAEAATYPGNKCVGDKMKAAGAACKAMLKAESAYLNGGDSDPTKRADALASAASKLSASWTKAEDKASSKSVDCADMTISSAGLQAILDPAVADLVADVRVGLTPSNDNDAKCGAALLKAASDRCAAFLKNQAGYINKLSAGTTKRDEANGKAQTKFADKVADALVGCPTAADAGVIGSQIDDIVADTTTQTTISPNVSDTQFDTISPLSNPPTPYEGSDLRPICSFGTPYHFFVKRGTLNKLVMYYQGGGACWDYLTCGLIGTFDKDVNPSGSDNPNNTTTGLGDLTNPANPFKDWNIVFVSYCTGDIHFGDAQQTYKNGSDTYNTRHKGWHNARIAEKFAREHFVNPDEVFVTGSSAGAYGAVFNAPLHHFVWPDSKFTVLADAGNGVVTPAFLINRFPKWNFAAHLPDNIPGVVEAVEEGTGIPAYITAVADFFPDTAWGHYSSSFDGGTGGQTGFYNVMQHDTGNVADAAAFWPNWWNASCAWNDAMRQQAIDTAATISTPPHHDNYRYYIGTGSRHTMYGSNKVYTDTTGGVPTIVSWINTMLARSGWNNVECSSDCNKLLAGDPLPDKKTCEGGTNDGASCTVDSACPGGVCDLAEPFDQVGPDVLINCP